MFSEPSAGSDSASLATSAVREAKNRRTFVKRARDEAGVDVDVITGVEEARLIYLGVLQALQVIDRDVMLVDIGGGSTEILVGHNGSVTAARSLKVGHIRLTDRFFPGGKVARDAVDDDEVEDDIGTVMLSFFAAGPPECS